VPSAWAYSRWHATRELASAIYEPQNFAGITLANDLEHPVFEKFLFLAQMKSWLRQQSEVGAALMSGSGSAILAVLRDGVDREAMAARAKNELDSKLWTCACKTL